MMLVKQLVILINVFFIIYRKKKFFDLRMTEDDSDNILLQKWKGNNRWSEVKKISELFINDVHLYRHFIFV